MTHEEILTCALDVGEQMLISGAEVYRVEDCIRRIGRAYGAVHADVFSITSSIIVTLEFPGDLRVTQTRRISSYETDLERVHRLNQLSRELCAETPDYKSFREKFQRILSHKRYGFLTEMAAYALIAAAFTVFFGGALLDAAVAAVIALVMNCSIYFSGKVRFNRALSNLIASFLMSVLAFTSVKIGIAKSAEMIIIGNIMLLIPGILLTNSLRDMISGDTITGILRFAEAIILALAIAGGYTLAFYAMGGAMV